MLVSYTISLKFQYGDQNHSVFLIQISNASYISTTLPTSPTISLSQSQRMTSWWIWIVLFSLFLLLGCLLGLMIYFVFKFKNDIEDLNRNQVWLRRHSTWRIPFVGPKTTQILQTIEESDPLNKTSTL